MPRPHLARHRMGWTLTVAKRKTPSKGTFPDKPMRDALRIELHSELKLPDPAGGNRFIREKKFRLVARALVNEGIKGDVAAIKEINDRIDGKVPSVVAGTGKDGAIPLDLKGMSEEQLEAMLARLLAYIKTEQE